MDSIELGTHLVLKKLHIIHLLHYYITYYIMIPAIKGEEGTSRRASTGLALRWLANMTVVDVAGFDMAH